MTPKIVTARFLRYFLAAKSGKKKIYIIIRKVINTKVEMCNDVIYKIYSELKSYKKMVRAGIIPSRTFFVCKNNAERIVKTAFISL